MNTQTIEIIQPETLKTLWTNAIFEVLLAIVLSLVTSYAQPPLMRWLFGIVITGLMIYNIRTLLFSLHSRVAFFSAFFIIVMIDLTTLNQTFRISPVSLWELYIGFKASFILMASSSKDSKSSRFFNRWINVPENAVWLFSFYLIWKIAFDLLKNGFS